MIQLTSKKQARAEWTVFDKDGKELGKGKSINAAKADARRRRAS